MNKMKMIDLLNKIANGEEIPQKIKFHNMIWYKESELSYCEDYYSETVGCYLFYNKWALTNNLNDEVEIIEDNKNEIYPLFYMGENINDKLYIIKDKINEIIDYIQGDIKDKINEIIDYIQGDKE